MKSSYLYLTLGLLALAIGFFVNRKGGEGVARKANPQFADTKSKSARLVERRSAEIQILNQARRLEGGEQNWLRWVAELENASREDLPRFLQNMPQGSDEAMDLLVERWFELGPEEALDYFSKRFELGEMEVGFRDRETQFMRSFFQLWTKRDVEGAVAAVNGLEAFPYLKEVHLGLAKKLAQKDPERGLRYAMKNGVNRSGWIFFVRGKKLQGLITKNPVQAADLIFEWGDSPGGHAEKELVKTWGKMNPKAAISYGLKRGNPVRSQFADGVFLSWAKRDYAEASDWVAGEASDEEAELFTAPLVEVWGREEPVAALHWAQEQLSGSVLNESVRRMVLGAIDSEEVNAGAMLKLIEDDGTRQEAAVALADHLWGSGSNPKADEETHLKRLRWFEGIEDAETMNRVVGSLSRGGVEFGAEWLTEFVQGPQMQLLDQRRSANLIGRFAFEGDFEKGLEMTQFVAEKHRGACAAEIFSDWAGRDSEKATAWLEELSPSDARLPFLGKGVAEGFFSRFQGGEAKEELIREVAKNYSPQMLALVKGEIVKMQRGFYEGVSDDEETRAALERVLRVISE